MAGDRVRTQIQDEVAGRRTRSRAPASGPSPAGPPARPGVLHGTAYLGDPASRPTA